MSSETPESVMDVERPDAEIEITPRLILLSMVTGLVGLVLMVPLLVGVPVALGVFRPEPLAEFANIGSFFGLQADLLGPIFGYDPTIVLGALLYVLGGVLFLPVQFLVVGGFLPPESPRYARGATFAMLWWGGFLAAFWPGGSIVTIGLFLVVSIVSHLIYGFSLGYLLDRWAEIPQHRV